jgi:hypothetical protein
MISLAPRVGSSAIFKVEDMSSKHREAQQKDLSEGRCERFTSETVLVNIMSSLHYF